MQMLISRHTSPIKDWTGVTEVVVREGALTEEMKKDLVYANRELKIVISSETPEAQKATSVLFTGA